MGHDMYGCSQTLQLFSHHVGLPVGGREQQGQQLGVSVGRAEMLLWPRKLRAWL